jgi:hypothetical protein
MNDDEKDRAFIAPSRLETYPAEDMLPRDLVAQIQRYFVGGRLYISRRGRAERIDRNRKIRRRYAALMRETKSGYGVIKAMAAEFDLTTESIRLILRNPESWVDPSEIKDLPT